MADVNDKSKKLEISGDLLHGSRDAQQARVAKGADVKAAQALNKNAHNGSAGGNQDHSCSWLTLTAVAMRLSLLRGAKLFRHKDPN